MLRHEFDHHLMNVEPGQVIVYHSGNLMSDRINGIGFMQVENVAQAAWQAMMDGKVTLLQARVQGVPGLFHYCAIKRKMPYEKVEWSGCYDPRPYHIKPTTKVLARAA